LQYFEEILHFYPAGKIPGLYLSKLTYQMEPFVAQVAPYYHRYIALVQGNDIISHLEKSMTESLEFLSTITEDQSHYAYAPGKWTIKEVMGHLIDAERIFAYRALRIARKDKTNLPGFEENDYVAAAGFNGIKWADLLHQFRTLRQSNVALFYTFSETQLQQEGTANDAPTNVKALIYIIAGHHLHHMNVIKERYLEK